jgi:muramidase (phage lysozyme)
MKKIILICVMAIFSHLVNAQESKSINIKLPSGKECNVDFKNLTISTSFSSTENVYAVLKEVKAFIKLSKMPNRMFFDIYLKTDNKVYYCNYSVSKKPREI